MKQIKKENVPKWLSEIKSPNENFGIVIFESGSEIYPVTTIMINSKGGGACVYDAFGSDLNIKANWKDNNTVLIEIKDCPKILFKRDQVELLNEVIRIKFKNE